VARLKRVPGAGVKKPITKRSSRVYLFIDDSNLFIEGQRTAANRDPHDASAPYRFRIDFGRFLEWVSEDRTLADVYLVGSRPPEVDTF
jgi:hypothetical protein